MHSTAGTYSHVLSNTYRSPRTGEGRAGRGRNPMRQSDGAHRHDRHRKPARGDGTLQSATGSTPQAAGTRRRRLKERQDRPLVGDGEADVGTNQSARSFPIRLDPRPDGAPALTFMKPKGPRRASRMSFGGRDARNSLWDTAVTSATRSERYGSRREGEIPRRFGPQRSVREPLPGSRFVSGRLSQARYWWGSRGSQEATWGGDCCRSSARCPMWRAQEFWARAAISTMTVWLCSPHGGSRRL